MGTSEALRLGDSFFLENYIMAYAIRKGDPLPSALTKSIWATHHTSNSTIYWTLASGGVNYDSLPQCPALSSNGQCSIYEARPAMCRSVPFDPLLPEKEQSISIVRFINSAISNGYPCGSPQPSDPVIWDNGIILGEPYKSGYEQGQISVMDYGIASGFLEKMLPKDQSQRTEMLMREVEETQKGHGRGGRLAFALLAAELCINGSISFDEFNKMAMSQILLGRKMVDQAVVRKNKEDRPKTAWIKNSIEMWELKLSELTST